VLQPVSSTGEPIVNATSTNISFFNMISTLS
jgi:hypothetical protein